MPSGGLVPARPRPLSHPVEALLRDLGPQLRRGQTPAETPAPWPTGIAPVDEILGGGFPRGRLAEITGPVSSGRTSIALALLATTTRAGESVAVVDAADAFDPISAEAAGVRLERTLWIRAPGQREVLRSTEILLDARGFALVVIDLAAGSGQGREGCRPASAAKPRAQRGEAQPRRAGRPASPADNPHGAQGERRQILASQSTAISHGASWQRLARAAARTQTTLVAISPERAAGPFAEIALTMQPALARFTGTPALLEGLDAEAVVVRNRTGPSDGAASIVLHFSPLAGAM